MVTLRFTSEYLTVLVFLWGFFALLFFYESRTKKQRALTLGNFKTLERVSGHDFIAPHHLFLVSRLLTVTALLLAVSQPVLVDTVPAADGDYAVAMDASASMFTDDIEPTRFDAAKIVASDVVRTFGNGTRIGVVSYAGEVARETDGLVAPGAAARSIEAIEMGDTAGTAIGGAITTATTMLLDTSRPRRVILVTDGANNAGIGIDEAVEYALSHNATVHTIGMGQPTNTSAGSGLIDGENATEAAYPDLDVSGLQDIANRTGGNASIVSNRSGLETAFADLAERQTEQPLTVPLVFLAVLLLVFEWVLRTTDYAPLP